MANMIVSENQIKTRFYNLVIDGDVVEEYLSKREANSLRDVYRDEGFAVDMIEVYSVNGRDAMVGDNPIKKSDTDGDGNKGFMTPSATPHKIERDRNEQRARNAAAKSRGTGLVNSAHYISYGRNKNSTLHAEYLALLRTNGFRVINKITGEIWLGLEKEIVDRILSFIKSGGSRSDLDIKFIGVKER